MKVLLALDGSAPSLVARDLVAALTWPDGTVVHLLAASGADRLDRRGRVDHGLGR